jgi:transcriptional regulator with XRE-family HTH domain
MVESFWERTNHLIKEFGYTQEILTLKCGFDEPRRIQNLSSGGRFPRAIELVQIARELKTSVEYLVTGEDFITELERDMLIAFNLLNDAGKDAAIGAVKALISRFPLPAEQAGALSKTAT